MKRLSTCPASSPVQHRARIKSKLASAKSLAALSVHHHTRLKNKISERRCWCVQSLRNNRAFKFLRRASKFENCRVGHQPLPALVVRRKRVIFSLVDRGFHRSAVDLSNCVERSSVPPHHPFLLCTSFVAHEKQRQYQSSIRHGIPSSTRLLLTEESSRRREDADGDGDRV